ncbi:uncharacterized protein LOC111281286 isoform X2 [Durio zibethinus]|uniref:Uncharacterized protein LOC111281286 isoform X2 n=1 Tax=Durio zibethinus TaxID=66656 RepID=A0A6P5XAW0_DURZI|nr:uncharacterized protein LOC111281286 isoform X2 [Durio zibethinus]
MDSKSKGIAWVGNIYKKFESMCMEVDDMVCQLQTVGANVKQLCTELVQEVLPSSPTNSVEEINLSLVQNVGVTGYEDSNVSVDEDHSKKELINSSSVESKQLCTELMQEMLPSSPTNSVEEINLSLVQNAGFTAYEDSNISVDEDHSQKELINSPSVGCKQFCAELMQEELPSSPTNSVEEINLSLVQNAGVTAYEDSNISVDEDHSQKELINSSSVESKQFWTELMQEELPSSPTNLVEEINSSLVQNAGLTAYKDSNISVDGNHYQKELINSSSVKSIENVYFGLSLEQSTEDESALADCSGIIPSDSVMLAQACKNELQYIDSTLADTSLELMEEASDKSVSEMELEAVLVPSFDEVKLEESCIIVYSNELHSLSNEAGEHRSYMKKFREAFSSKSRLAKRINEQHAESTKEKGNGVGPSIQTNKSESQDMEFCESDWEII